MELSLVQQIYELCKKSQSILIATPDHADYDTLSAAAGLAITLERQGKAVTLIGPETLPEDLGFFPETVVFKKELSMASGGLTILLKTQSAQLDELRYEVEPEEVKIFLKPKNGVFTSGDVRVESGVASIDLVITIGTGSLESLGSLFVDHSDLLYGVAKINFDKSPANEYFGTINSVDVVASSNAELVARTLLAQGDFEIPSTAATCFLGGIMHATSSFQFVSTTANTFVTASGLLRLGADQELVVQHLFKTKQFNLLKLWGRTLARLEESPSGQTLFAVLNQQDFEKSETSEADIPNALRELVKNVSGFASVAVVVTTNRDSTLLVLASLPHINTEVIAQKFGLITPVSLPLFGQFLITTFETSLSPENVVASLQ
jgi:nanoRNase/pAp phosphatase (c-di-AMP/oligoRNAs hydrolase)